MEKLRYGRIGTWMTVLAIGVTACVSGPRAADVTERRTAAVAFAFIERASVLALVRQCSFDPTTQINLAAPAKAALDAWTQRHDAVMEAANLYLEDYLAVFARRSGRRKAAEERTALTRKYTASGGLAAQKIIDDAGGKQRCSDLLERLERGDLDLESAEFDPTLEELIAKYVTPKT